LLQERNNPAIKVYSNREKFFIFLIIVFFLKDVKTYIILNSIYLAALPIVPDRVSRSAYKRLTNNKRNSFSIPSDLNQVIIGLSLGDLNINKKTNYARLSFVQGSINEVYILHLYELFTDYCGTGPKDTARKQDKRTGKIYNWMRFNTYSLPCFNYYYDLFYVEKVKRIPINIGELLTPLGLAY
jgi:hypothetical protein